MGTNPYQMQGDTLDRVGLGLVKPPLHGQEAGPAGYVIDQEDAVGTTVEACRESAEPLLAGLVSVISTLYFCLESKVSR